MDNLKLLIGLLFCLLPLRAVAGPMPVVTGPVETVFDWSEQRCALWDIPDAPARAWRGADGRVRLVAGAERNRVAAGPDLGAVRHDCAVVYAGAGLDDPAAYDDRAWIAAVYVEGDRVEALVHGEYHGDKRPERCPAADYAACWRNVIVAVTSRDGGRGFGEARLVAALPYRYDGAAGRRSGYFNPGNILRDGDFLYAFVFAESYGAQKRGACLLRRPVVGGAGDWRAWDGAAFRVRFADPYREDIRDPADHVCAPIEGIDSTVSSVARHAPSGRFLAVTPATRRDAAGAEVSGIYALASDDLIHWSAPALLWAAPLLWRRDCGAEAAYAYPSLIDEGSASPNFDTVGEEFWLYLTRMRLDGGCAVGPDRDLIRMRVSWPATAAGSPSPPAPPAAPRDRPGESPAP